MGALVLLGVLWGGALPFIRVAVPGPKTGVAGGPAGPLGGPGLVIPYAVAVGRLPALRSRWREFLLLGCINAAVPFTLIAASEVALTTPLFSAVVAAFWIGETLSAKKIAGLVLGIAGVVVLVRWTPIPFDRVVALSIGASLLTTLCYTLGATYAKRTFSEPSLWPWR